VTLSSLFSPSLSRLIGPGDRCRAYTTALSQTRERERERVNKRSTLSLSLSIYIIDRYTCIWPGIPIHFLFHNLFLFPPFFYFYWRLWRRMADLPCFDKSLFFILDWFCVPSSLGQEQNKTPSILGKSMKMKPTLCVCVCVCVTNRPKNGLKKTTRKQIIFLCTTPWVFFLEN
jgi:hypothetical protein